MKRTVRVCKKCPKFSGTFKGGNYISETDMITIDEDMISKCRCSLSMVRYLKKQYENFEVPSDCKYKIEHLILKQ